VNDRLDRERALERLLPDVLSEASGPGSGCVEAETLAAWSSGHLRASEAAAVEAHLSDCAHCQAVLGTFVRSAPPAPVEPVWSRWHLRWLVPLATAATALTVYLLVPGLDRRLAPEQTITQADPRRESPGVPAPDAGANRQPAGSTPAPTSPQADPVSRPAASPPPRAGRVEEPSQSRGAFEAGLRRGSPAEPPSVDKQAKTETPQSIRDSAAAPPRREVATSETARRDAPAVTAPPPPASPAAAEARSPAKSAPVAPRVAGETAATPERPADALLRLRRQANVTIDIPTPVRTHRFRIVDGQRVERTTTGGERWESVARPVAGAMTAGAAPAADICWIVGGLGAVWRTTDGQVLVRVPFPQTVDLVAVAADSATAAAVTAADGRTFRTSDGGQTWR
jgi:hypothetical protein